ncbi:MAG: hypothetical protein AAF443_02955 [Chlamydiota bacterium]
MHGIQIYQSFSTLAKSASEFIQRESTPNFLIELRKTRNAINNNAWLLSKEIKHQDSNTKICAFYTISTGLLLLSQSKNYAWAKRFSIISAVCSLKLGYRYNLTQSEKNYLIAQTANQCFHLIASVFCFSPKCTSISTKITLIYLDISALRSAQGSLIEAQQLKRISRVFSSSLFVGASAFCFNPAMAATLMALASIADVATKTIHLYILVNSPDKNWLNKLNLVTAISELTTICFSRYCPQLKTIYMAAGIANESILCITALQQLRCSIQTYYFQNQ